MNLTKRGGVYYASFRTAEGKRKTISTRCSDRTQALKVVKESGLSDLEAAAKAGRLTQQAIGHITTGKKLSIVSAIEKYANSISNRRSPRTVDNHLLTLTSWAEDMGVQQLPPAAITEEHIDPWINNPESKAKAATRRVDLSALRSFFDWCADRGYCVGNPAGRQRVAVNFSILSHEQKEPGTRDIFTELELKSIRVHLASRITAETALQKQLEKQKEKEKTVTGRKHLEKKISESQQRQANLQFWQFAAHISNELGLRLGDIAQLEWACFSTPGRVVVWTDKRDRRISVPYSDALDDLLTAIPVSSEKYLFPEQRDMQIDPKRRAVLSKQFTRLLEAIGIKGKSFHCFRHTRITRWRREGKSLEAIGEYVGHTNPETTKGYIH
jgi:integrase